MKRVLIACLLATALSACVPVRLLDAPGYDLSLVDARTHQPIAGAAVRIRGGNRGQQLVSAVSDAKGRVLTTHAMHMALLPLKHELRVPPIQLVISAEGYQTRELSAFDPLFIPHGCRRGENDCHYTQSTVVDTATIELQPR